MFDKVSGSYNRDTWFINDVKDIVVNDQEPFIDENEELIVSNLKTNLDWFNKSYFISKYFFIKFIYDNLSVDGSQLNFVFNSYEVNAVKSLR